MATLGGFSFAIAFTSSPCLGVASRDQA